MDEIENKKNVRLLDLVEFSSAGEHNNRNLGIVENGELVGLLGGNVVAMDKDSCGVGFMAELSGMEQEETKKAFFILTVEKRVSY